ncbi:MAG: response regulator transcription factor [Polyangiaceae bacterium]|nr:response regulator transcription factor [Polyangiaceae bacterium]
MRSVIYRFPDLAHLEEVLSGAGPDGGAQGQSELELGVPAGEPVTDGEWVLAIFELGTGRRATSAAARAVVSPEGARLTFEPRDWRRLETFVRGEAKRPASLPEIEAEGGGAEGSARGSPSTPPAHEGARRTRPSAAPGARRSTRPPPAYGKGARVLVVDDDPDIRELVAVMLEAVELVVTPVSSAEEALARMRVESFDLLVLDWNLPRMSGIELCRILRQEEGLCEMPVLFLTANASSQDMVEAFASGADDYVVKPFRAPELGARIFSLLRRVRRSWP